MQYQDNFFTALFDFSFRSFITEKIIPFLYILSIIVSGLVALAIIIAGFDAGAAVGVLALVIVAPIYFIVSVVYSRVILEFLIVVFRIADYVKDIAGQGGLGPRGYPRQ